MKSELGQIKHLDSGEQFGPAEEGAGLEEEVSAPIPGPARSPHLLSQASAACRQLLDNLFRKGISVKHM